MGPTIAATEERRNWRGRTGGPAKSLKCGALQHGDDFRGVTFAEQCPALNPPQFVAGQEEGFVGGCDEHGDACAALLLYFDGETKTRERGQERLVDDEVLSLPGSSDGGAELSRVFADQTNDGAGGRGDVAACQRQTKCHGHRVANGYAEEACVLDGYGWFVRLCWVMRQRSARH